MRHVVRARGGSGYPQLPLDTNAQVLVQPYRDGRALLEELEDKVDGRQEHCMRVRMGKSDVTQGWWRLAHLSARRGLQTR